MKMSMLTDDPDDDIVCYDARDKESLKMKLKKPEEIERAT
jgi:hypothetical protein